MRVVSPETMTRLLSSSAIRLDFRGKSKNGAFRRERKRERALALRCNNRKVVTRPCPSPAVYPLCYLRLVLFSLLFSLFLLLAAHMRARGKGRPPWKNHGFTRQIAYAYKAVLFRALTHRRVYLTDIPIRPRCILCGVLYLLAVNGIAVENKPACDFPSKTQISCRLLIYPFIRFALFESHLSLIVALVPLLFTAATIARILDS